jgi:hypothetical protein
MGLATGLLLPSGMVLLTWRDATSDVLVIDAPAMVGTTKTSLAAEASAGPMTVALSIGVGGDVPLIYSSHSGECSITLTMAEAAGVQGTLVCTAVKNGAQSINATGAFSAQP